ncbi:MAG: PEGA domain-containing protein [Candidatus Diapherotrites archaeon]|nr:PEGA domain-containing protein [Candidatus Diapherotrites archaeon]
MKKVLIIFLLLFSVLQVQATAEVSDVYLHIGESIKLDNTTVTLVDISQGGEMAFLRINGKLYGLQFGEKVKIRNLTIYLGNIDIEEKTAHIIVRGARINQEDSNIVLEVSYPSKIANSNSEVEFSIYVTNKGRDGIFKLSSILPKGFEGSFYAENSEIEEVYLKHGETKVITFKVKIPDVEGNFKLFVHVGDAIAEVHLKIRKIESYEVHAKYLGKSVEAGQEVEFPITIRATRNTIVPLEASLPKGWEGCFKVGNDKVTKLEVSSDSQVTFVVKIPSNAPVGNYQAIAKIGNRTIVFEVYVEKTHAGEQGVVSFKVVDASSGSYISKALVKAGNISTYTTPDGEAQLKLPEGEYTLQIIKEGYKPYETEIEVLAGEKIDLGIIQIKKLPYYFKVECHDPHKTVVLKEDTIRITYHLTINNLGLNDDSYSIFVKLPHGWSSIISEREGSSVSVNQVFIKAERQKEIYLTLIPPQNVKLGEYNFTLRIKSNGMGETREIPLKAKLSGSYGLHIYMPKYSYTAEAGKEREISVRIYNIGTIPLTNLRLNVSTPSDWVVEVTPERISSLDVRETAEFTLILTPPKNLDAGDYEVVIKAVSDQWIEEKTIRVTVEKGSAQTYIGVGIILVSLLMLGVFIRQYGRK